MTSGAELIGRPLAGDGEALTEVIVHHEEFGDFMKDRASPLHQSAYALCGDWHLAHDLVQDTLVKAYQHWPRVRQADSPDAYVWRILMNEARSLWRRRDRAVPVPRLPEWRGSVTPDAADEIAGRAGLLQALRALPSRQRATVTLRYLEGMGEREIAAVLDCGEGTVKSQSARGLGALRRSLAPRNLRCERGVRRLELSPDKACGRLGVVSGAICRKGHPMIVPIDTPTRNFMKFRVGGLAD